MWCTVCLWCQHFAFNSGKKRKPAWTDRILWRIKPKTLSSEDDEKTSVCTDDEQDEYPLVITQDKYNSDMSYGVSDHKPVTATFTLEVRPFRYFSLTVSSSCLFLAKAQTCVPQLRKYFDTPLVHISPIGVWSADQDALLNYTVQEDFMSSTWDWIGLYKVQDRHVQVHNQRCNKWEVIMWLLSCRWDLKMLLIMKHLYGWGRRNSQRPMKSLR